MCADEIAGTPRRAISIRAIIVVVAVLSDVPVEATDLGGGLRPGGQRYRQRPTQSSIFITVSQMFNQWSAPSKTSVGGRIAWPCPAHVPLSLRLFCGFLEDVKGVE